MRTLINRNIRLIAVVIIACACFISGCVELKYTALNKLDTKVAVKSSRPVQTVFFSLPRLNRSTVQWGDYFSKSFAAALEARGLAIADNSAQADIVIKAYPKFYTKQQGTFLFVLLLPTYRFTEEYDGLLLKVYFKTDKGRWCKYYRVYYRSWLDNDLEMSSDNIIKAIFNDISGLVTGG